MLKGFKGRKCGNYESNYHSFKEELLALMYGLTKFEHLLRLNQFIVVTDSTTVLHWATMKDTGGTHIYPLCAKVKYVP